MSHRNMGVPRRQEPKYPHEPDDLQADLWPAIVVLGIAALIAIVVIAFKALPLEWDVWS